MNVVTPEPFERSRAGALAARRRIGRYYLHDAIGSGGMATVHLGWDVDGERVVAIKRLRADLAANPDFVAMFADEARLAARIVHRNVVGALDVVESNGELLLVLAYVRGGSLSQLARRAADCGERLPAGITAAVAIGVLRGLHATHEATGPSGEALAIVHRDVSPQNVMVDADGVTRILDFGVAESEGGLRANRAGEVRGKIHYMAPEQLTYDGVVSRRTDIYAASVVLWECLSGRRLFKDELRDAALDESAASKACVDALVRRYASIPSPSGCVVEATTALDAIVLRGLDPSPSKRFATAEEMADAIAACGVASSEDEVGDWVRSLEDPELEERERSVAALERSAGAACVTGHDEELESAPQSGWVRRRRYAGELSRSDFG